MEEHKQRYAAAIAVVPDAESLALGTTMSPAEQPEHLFDFVDGVRFIIFRQVDNGKSFVHFYANVYVGQELEKKVKSGELTIPQLLGLMVERFREISDNHNDAKFAGFTPMRLTPFWIVEA
jgi:hypothetical protein